MRAIWTALSAAVCLAGSSSAQEDEPWIIYGFASLDAGDSVFVRIEVEWDGPAARWAPFGTAPLPFEEVAAPPDSSWLAFRWPGREFTRCRLDRRREFHFAGVCEAVDGGSARAIELGGGYAPDLGQDLAPGEQDLRIVERAAALLTDEGRWNRADERVCDDDRQTGSLSLFCALYVASIEVTGEYLHRRPAMAAPREVVYEQYPERVFAHTLRDFNNARETTHEELQEILREARARLERTIRDRRPGAEREP